MASVQRDREGANLDLKIVFQLLHPDTGTPLHDMMCGRLHSAITVWTLLMTTHLFQFRFADTEQYWHPSWLITLTSRWTETEIGLADAEGFMRGETRDIASATHRLEQLKSCTPCRAVRWHDHVPRDLGEQDEGTGDGSVTVLMSLTFMTIGAFWGSAVLSDLHRARATLLHGSYRDDPCTDVGSVLTKHLRAQTA